MPVGPSGPQFLRPRQLALIIDSHTHIFPPRQIAGRAAIARREPWFGVLYGSGGRMATAERLLEEMDRSGIERSLAFGFGWRDPHLCREQNEYLVESAERSAGRIRVAITVPMGEAAAAEAELDHFANAPIAGVGELYAGAQGFDLGTLAQDSCLPQICRQNDLILCVHVSEPAGHNYPGKDLTGPRSIGKFIAGMPPGLRLQLPHWGAGFGIYESMPEVAAATASVRYDCAASHLLYDRRIYHLMSQIAPQRIMFGSDFPLTGQARMLARVKKIGLPADLLTAFLGGNAAAWGI